MEFDLVTVSALTSLVVVVAGVVFIAETLLREDDIVSRLWSLAFLSGILTSLAYMIWALAPQTWWAVAIGNAAFVASGGFMWLGCRAFNDRAIGWPLGVVGFLTAAACVTVIIEGPDGGAWAGANVMFVSLFVLPGAAAIEALRGQLGRIKTTLGFTLVLGMQSLYYLGRTIVSLVFGTDSDVFTTWWGTVSTSIVTITLMVVAVVVASVLRAERAGLRGRETLTAPVLTGGAVLEARSFQRFLRDAVRRAQLHGERIGVISVRIDDLDQVSTAFGAEEADELRSAWREAMRTSVPTQAWIGDDGAGGLVVSSVVADATGARRIAKRLRRGVHEALEAVHGSVIPVIGVGVVMSDASDRGPADLVLAARAAAAEAAISEDSSVVVAD
ncbi:diguanylate cyclase domain-containing protein [Microbacterium sp. GXF0217]